MTAAAARYIRHETTKRILIRMKYNFTRREESPKSPPPPRRRRPPRIYFRNAFTGRPEEPRESFHSECIIYDDRGFTPDFPGPV